MTDRTEASGREGVPLLSLIIPTRNEAATAPELVSQLSRVLQPISAEVIFVDDSDDDTSSLIERAASENGLNARVIHRTRERRRGGLSSAVVEGLRAAEGRYFLVMDADLQHPTEMIVPLVECAVELQADIVIASRYVKGGSDAGLSSRSRKLISWAARWVVILLLFDKLRGIHDPLSGFFVARKPIVDETALRPIGFKILLDILARCDYSIVKEQPLQFAERGGGTSKATISQGRDFLTHVIALVWEVRVARHFRRRTRPAIEPDG